MDVAPVQVRLKAINEAVKIDDEGITDIERLTKELCNVVKDHNNVSISNFVTDSVNYCYTRKLAESVDDWTEEDKIKIFGERRKTKRIDASSPLDKTSSFSSCEQTRLWRKTNID